MLAGMVLVETWSLGELSKECVESECEPKVADSVSWEELTKWDDAVSVEETSDIVTIVAIVVEVCELRKVWTVDTSYGK